MNERYQQIYEDENGNEIPHFDLAENIDYDNSESSLNSENVQDAITELSRIPVLRMIEEFEGYDDKFCDPDYQDFELPDLTISEYIYYASDTAIDWSQNTDAINRINPAKWNAKAFRKYFVPDNVTGWNPLTSSSPNTNKEYVYVSVRRRSLYVHSFEGYSTPVLLSEILAGFDDEHPNDIINVAAHDIFDDFKNHFNELNETLLDNARQTREFLQNIIDNAALGDTIVFPKNKTFVVDFDPKGYIQGFWDFRAQWNVDFTQLKKYDVTTGELTNALWNDWASVQFRSLVVRNNVTIDLNGSTIKLIPNWLHNGSIMYIGLPYYFWSSNTANSRPKDANGNIITYHADGTVLKNGTIDGGTKLYFPSPGANNGEYEHHHAISAHCTINIENITCGNVSGDGMSVGSTKSTSGKSVYDGKLTTTGTIETATNYHYTDFASIASLNDHHYSEFGIVIRPNIISSKEYSTLIDIAPFYISENITVAYYNSDSESSYISQQTVRFGDTLNIPSNARYIRCSFEARLNDSYSDDVLNDNSISLGVIIIVVNWAYDMVIQNCIIHDCWRDGITFGAMPRGIVKNTTIKNCLQKSLNAENIAYIDDDLTIDNIDIGKDTRGVSVTTGSNYKIINSKLSLIAINGPQLVVEDSDIGTLISGPVNDSKAQKTFNKNISRPRRIIRNTVIRTESLGVNTIYNNCIFTGSFDIYRGAAHLNDFPNVFNHCTIKTRNLGPGIYNDCIIRYEDYLDLHVYFKATTEQSKYVFKNCIIEVNAIYNNTGFGLPTGVSSDYKTGPVIEMDSCKIVVTKHPKVAGQFKPNFHNCWISKFVNNIVTFTSFSDADYDFLFKPYGNAVMTNNVFIAKNTTTRVNLWRLEASDAPHHGTNFVTIDKNVVKTYKNSAANDNTFVQVSIMDSDVGFDVLVDRNAFECVSDEQGSATNVLTRTVATGVTNTKMTLLSSNSKVINAADPVEYNIN